jgi:hypothetical protein
MERARQGQTTSFLTDFAPHRARQKADFQRDAPMHMGGLELRGTAVRVEP